MTGSTTAWQPPSAQERLALLRRSQTIAIVGASDNPARASFFVATYLLSSTDFTVWFVNPRVETILGQPVYASLSDLPGTPDIVDAFRRPDDMPTVLDESLEVGAGALWMQLGITHEETAQRGTEAGMAVVMDRCIKIEHARFHRGLHYAGFNTGVISSRRRLP